MFIEVMTGNLMDKAIINISEIACIEKGDHRPFQIKLKGSKIGIGISTLEYERVAQILVGNQLMGGRCDD